MTMDLEGDGPAPRPPAAPHPTTPQSLHVTPDNVVALASTFRDCGDRLTRELHHLDQDLRLREAWMSDPVSKWARHRFNEYFVDGKHSFVHIVQSEWNQHRMIGDALVATARLYGLTEELISAGFEDIGMDE
jgi:hypothetical protein